MSVTKKLGRGFDSLIPQNFDTSLLVDQEERIQKLPLSSLVANPEQPRKEFNTEALEGLAESIKAHGILQPIVVTPHGNNYYVIAGERRWRAAKLAKLSTIPAIVRSAQQLERLELALVENVQRVNLSPLEQAASIQYLHDQFNMEYAVIAGRLGKAPTTVQNIARLLQLSKLSMEALASKQITEGHARSILAFKDEKIQNEFLDLIIKNGWSVRQAERYVIARKKGAQSSTKATDKVANTNPQTEHLGSALKTTVTIRRMAKGGKLEIAFKNESDLKRIIKTIQP